MQGLAKHFHGYYLPHSCSECSQSLLEKPESQEEQLSSVLQNSLTIKISTLKENKKLECLAFKIRQAQKHVLGPKTDHK